MGALAAQWFSDFLGRPLRLVRFDPRAETPVGPAWTGEIEAENAFADGFPLLVRDRVARRVEPAPGGRGAPRRAMKRFRPNLVLDGLDAHDEDLIDTR